MINKKQTKKRKLCYEISIIIKTLTFREFIKFGSRITQKVMDTNHNHQSSQNDIMMLLFAIRDGSFSGYDFIFERVVPLLLTTYLVRLNVDILVQSLVNMLLNPIKRYLARLAQRPSVELCYTYECKWDDALLAYIEKGVSDDPRLIVHQPLNGFRHLSTSSPVEMGPVSVHIANESTYAVLKIYYKQQADVKRFMMNGRSTSKPTSTVAKSTQILHRQLAPSAPLERTGEFYRVAYSLQYACISSSTRLDLSQFIREHTLKRLIPNFKTQSYAIFSGAPGRGKSAAISAVAQAFSYSITHLPHYFTQVTDLIKTLQNRTKEILVIDDMQKTSFWYYLLCNNATECTRIIKSAREAERAVKKEAMAEQRMRSHQQTSSVNSTSPSSAVQYAQPSQVQEVCDESAEVIERLEPFDYILSALDGPKTSGDKVIIITTNITKSELLADIPGAMRRPGRFNCIIEFNDMGPSDCEHFVDSVIKQVISEKIDTHELVRQCFSASNDATISPAEFSACLTGHLAASKVYEKDE